MWNVNLIGLLAAVGSIVVFKLVYERLKTRSCRVKLAAALVFGIAAMPAMLAAAYYLHFIPERAWFYELRSWRGSEWLILPLAVSAGCLAALLPRFALPVLLLLLLAAATVPYVKPLIFPLPADSFRVRWENGVCLQSTASSCGPASVASILHSLGVDVSEQEIAKYAHTHASGTEAWYLARFVRSKGLMAKFDFRDGLPDDIRLPAMLGVRFGTSGHFIAVLEKQGGRFTIADPLFGREVLTLEDLKKRCELTAFHMSISR